MALGRVIHDKLNPVRCLNKNDSVAIPPDDVYKDKKPSGATRQKIRAAEDIAFGVDTYTGYLDGALAQHSTTA